MNKTNLKEYVLAVLKKNGVSVSTYALLYRRYYMLINWLKYGDPFFFRGVFIETSTYCNRRCEYCPNSINPMPVGFMDEAMFKEVIAQLKKINFSATLCYHFFNEPLLDKRLAGFVSYARRNLPACIHRIFTNGDFLTLEKASELIEAGVSEFLITIHDRDEKDLRAKLEPVAKKHPTRLIIQSIRGGPLSNRGGAIEVPIREERTTCTSYLENLMIDYQGNVLLCCQDFYRQHKFGNIMHDQITSIWNKPAFSMLRKELRQGVARLELCKKCLYQEAKP